MMHISSKKLIPAALAMSLLGTGVAFAQGVTTIGEGSDTVTVVGQSGGSVKSEDCGFISKQPNRIIKVTAERLKMKLSVEAQGQPTLLVEGPTGRFCILPDEFSGGNPELSGLWLNGDHEVYVGQLESPAANPEFTLSVSVKN